MLLKSLKYSLLIWLSLAGEAPASAKVETWVEVRSLHFRVIANSSEKDARRVTIQFEPVAQSLVF